MTDLKLIVPKEIDNRINPEYTRHVKKFDMLSMPRRIDNVSGKHLTFEKGRYEVGLPLEAVREDLFFFSSDEKQKAAKYATESKSKQDELKEESRPVRYSGNLSQGEVQRRVAVSKKKRRGEAAQD